MSNKHYNTAVARYGHRPRIINGAVDLEWLLKRGCTYYAPLNPAYGANAIINNGEMIRHRSAAPVTQTVDSVGTFLNSASGYIAGASTDTLRVEAAGARLEQARTNLATYSEDFRTSGTDWLHANSPTVSDPDQDTAPDGTVTASTIEDTASGTVGIAYQTITTSGSVLYTISLFIKKSTSAQSHNPGFLCTVSPTSISYGVSLNTFTGAVTAITSGISVSWTAPSSIYADSFGDYWRLQMTFNNAGRTSCLAQVCPAFTTSAAPAVASVTPTGAITCWGFQFEQGNFSSSYIPTTSAAVARAVDILEPPTTAFHWQGGMVAFTFIAPWTGTAIGADVTLFDCIDGTGANRVRFFWDQSEDDWTYQVRRSATNDLPTSFGISVTRGEVNVFVLIWEKNRVHAYLNGVKICIDNDTGGAVPVDAGSETMRLGALRATGQEAPGLYSNLIIGKYAPPAGDIVGLSDTLRTLTKYNYEQA